MFLCYYGHTLIFWSFSEAAPLRKNTRIFEINEIENMIPLETNK